LLHALYGRRLCLQYSEARSGARLSFVEAGTCLVIVMRSWMLDPAACPTRRSARGGRRTAVVMGVGRRLTDTESHLRNGMVFVFNHMRRIDKAYAQRRLDNLPAPKYLD
jgi:hypothetical protein